VSQRALPSIFCYKRKRRSSRQAARIHLSNKKISPQLGETEGNPHSVCYFEFQSFREIQRNQLAGFSFTGSLRTDKLGKGHKTRDAASQSNSNPTCPLSCEKTF
jgi:hypothetical protein